MCDKCGIVENTVNYDEELDCDLCIDCHFKDDVINDQYKNKEPSRKG